MVITEHENDIMIEVIPGHGLGSVTTYLGVLANDDFQGAVQGHNIATLTELEWWNFFCQ